jgi:hypothetical protein
VLEAVLIALAGKPPEEMTADQYGRMLEEMNIEPRVKVLNKQGG